MNTEDKFLHFAEIIGILASSDDLDTEVLGDLLNQISSSLHESDREILNRVSKIRRFVRSNEIGLARFELDRIRIRLEKHRD